MGALDLVVVGRGTDAAIQIGVMGAVVLFGIAGVGVYMLIKIGPRKFAAEIRDGFKDFPGGRRL